MYACTHTCIFGTLLVHFCACCLKLQHRNDCSVVASHELLLFTGVVYNVTYYLAFHPGGKSEIMKAAGTDCTSLFNQVRTLQVCIV